ncbi:hypothetical protein LCGC14_1168470 [marine sediment metagenome]|uniref:Uncharacterized protein n=2 Tax=root TaxID=1 RepID=A0A831VLD1_9FLAO|nr:hypothetical protein [Pricia sp.]HEA19560.1 hypothetical protein [Pricia antarctica]
MEEKYRVKTNVQDRALTGISMGELQTIYAGIKNTDILILAVLDQLGSQKIQNYQILNMRLGKRINKKSTLT